jgi:hypothetical protein
MRQSREKVDPMNGCTGDSFGSCIEPEGRGTFGLISQEYIPDAPSRETREDYRWDGNKFLLSGKSMRITCGKAVFSATIYSQISPLWRAFR